MVESQRLVAEQTKIQFGASASVSSRGDPRRENGCDSSHHHEVLAHPDEGCRPGLLIRVYVTPNAREARMVKLGEDYFEVRVDEMAAGGRAHKRLLEILAEHFKVQKSRISILKGTKTRNKLVQVILERTPDSPLQS